MSRLTRLASASVSVVATQVRALSTFNIIKLLQSDLCFLIIKIGVVCFITSTYASIRQLIASSGIQTEVNKNLNSPPTPRLQERRKSDIGGKTAINTTYAAYAGGGLSSACLSPEIPQKPPTAAAAAASFSLLTLVAISAAIFIIQACSSMPPVL